MIEIRKLVKQFGSRTAVDGLELRIPAGEIFGLLGPNGAGKTTTIRILTTLAKASSGEVLVHGFRLGREDAQIKKLIGVVPQHFNLDVDLTVEENLELHGRLHHMERSLLLQRMEMLLEYVELQDRRKERIQSLSGGMKRRVMIARALLHEPKILFLDEPTVGLDPQVRRRLWDLIRRLNKDGVTVLLTTHYIEEAEHLCQRVGILDKGQLIALDTPAVLCQRVGRFVVEWPGEEGLESRFFSERSEAAAFAAQLAGDAVLRQSNLEDVFVEMTGRRVSV